MLYWYNKTNYEEMNKIIISDIFKDDAYWVFVVCGNSTDKHYQQFGYEIPKEKNKKGRMVSPVGTKILVKIEDLTIQSGAKVTKVCDICSKQIYDQPYASIIKSRKNTDGKDRCKECAMNYVKTQYYYEDPPYEKALAFKYPYIASTWNYELNKNITPENVFSHTNSIFWFTCKICKSDFDMMISDRVKLENSCPYCAGRRVNHTNCIKTTYPEIAAMLWNSEDGVKYTIGSEVRLNFRCLECDQKVENKIPLNVLKQGLSCSLCSDGVSYPEKFISSVISQISENVEHQKMFIWSNKASGQTGLNSGRKLYDFYIPSLNCIVESHGQQHYTYGFKNFGGKSLEEEQENDKFKKELALLNGIEHYVIVKCDKSAPEYLKEQIIKSELSSLFNLDIVDWSKCHEHACKSFVKTACELWLEFKNTQTIANIMKVNRTTATTYLKQGSKLGWCDYDPKEEMRKSGSKNKNNEKPVIRMTLNNEIIDEFKSATEAANKLNLSFKTISTACNGKVKSAGGFRWMHKSDFENVKNDMEPYKRKLTNKPVIRLTLDNSYIDEFMSASEAERQLSISNSSISNVCRGVYRHKSAGGFKWMYKSEYVKLKV